MRFLPAPVRAAVRKAQAAGTKSLGDLPEWNLGDLYAGMEAPAYAADLAQARTDCLAFAADYRGKVESLAKGATAAADLTGAVKRYEALDDLIGRIMSYAGLIYAGDTTNPARAKFYGDTQDKIKIGRAHV